MSTIRMRAMVRYLISGRITMIPTRTSTHFILIDDAALHIKWYFMDVSLRTPMRIYVFVVPPLRSLSRHAAMHFAMDAWIT